MAHNIIMPALGMAQETGTILAWHKQLGDPIKASDVIMEIETDKTTVEIEAGHDGFLTSILAETGVPVPVGEVVAIVSADASDIGAAPAEKNAKPAPKEAAKPSAQPSEKPAEKPPEATPPALQADKAPARPAPTPSSAPDGRVLASPKARRLAAERGIDLHRLVQLGAVQPLHVNNIDRAPLSGGGALATHSILRARIERAAFDSFITWIREEAEIPLDALNVWAAFAAAAYRKAAAFGDEAEIVVQASRLGDDLETVALRNPDQVGLSAIKAGETGAKPAVALLDLTGSALIEYRPAPAAALQFTIADGMRDETFDLALAFDPAVFPLRNALMFLKDLTARTEQPLRHLI